MLGQHVEHHEVRPAVVVEVGGVHAHGGVARVAHGPGDRLGERAVAVVDVEKIVFLKVVGDVQVGAAVEVQVARDDAQAIPFDAAVDAGLVAHVHEVAAVVPVEAVARPGVARPAQRVRAGRALHVGRVVQQVHVQVAVSVIIEEEGLRGIAGKLETVLLRAVGERAVAVVDEEHVVPVHPEIVDARDVDIDVAVPVDVGHRGAGLPARGIRDAGAVGDVLEPVIPLVQVEPVGAHVRREVEVREAVVVDVAHRHAPAVVVVHVAEDVERGVVRQPVDERDAGLLGRQ